MGLVLLGAVVGAIVSAIVTVYLQKRLTRDPADEITALRKQVKEHAASFEKQVADFRKRVEPLEQERTESEHFPFEIALQQAASQNYIMLAKNNSDEEVTIETVTMERNGVALSEPNKPKGNDDWRIPPRSGKTIYLAPQHDPTVTVQYSEPGLGIGVAVPITMVAACRVRDRTITKRRTHLVTIDFRNRSMTPYGP